jgi:hypothetical protein
MGRGHRQRGELAGADELERLRDRIDRELHLPASRSGM